jgi:hypothetical protein
MRLITTIILLTFIYSCKNTENPDKEQIADNNFLTGEWRLDSSSNHLIYNDKAIILEDGSFYLFSGSDGGSLITTGKRFTSDSISTEYYGNLTIKIIDSNHIRLRSDWTNTESFYRRIKNDYRETLKEYLKQDTLRRKVIGWWKLAGTKMPVKLINNSGYYEKFTINIRSDGNAIFYLDNKLDSTVSYSYHVNTDGIEFSRGCMNCSNCHTSFDSKERMKLVLDNQTGDTLLLERITEIR